MRIDSFFFNKDVCVVLKRNAVYTEALLSSGKR